MEFEKVIELLDTEKLYARTNFVPIIRDKSAEFLYDYVKKVSPKNILEIGTAIGYSGCIMLSACDKSMLYTVDINTKSLEVAKNTFSKFGYNDRVQIIEYVQKIRCENNLTQNYIFECTESIDNHYINQRYKKIEDHASQIITRLYNSFPELVNDGKKILGKCNEIWGIYNKVNLLYNFMILGLRRLPAKLQLHERSGGFWPHQCCCRYWRHPAASSPTERLTSQ